MGLVYKEVMELIDYSSFCSDIKDKYKHKSIMTFKALT